MMTFLLLSGHWIVASLVTVRIIYRRLAVGTSLAWLFILFFVPYAGIFIYLLIGESHLGYKRAQRNRSIKDFHHKLLQENK